MNIILFFNLEIKFAASGVGWGRYMSTLRKMASACTYIIYFLT